MNLQTMPPVLELDADAWALRINARWRQSIENYFETGDLLIDAKAKLPHGEFEAMVETSLMFHSSTARRLMIIAKDNRLRAHVHALPPSWGTIYELSKLSDDELDRGFKAKTIHTEMERKDVDLIRPRPEGYMHDAYTPQSSDASGSRVADNPRPHGEGLQQGLDTSSIPGTADSPLPQGEGTVAASVANPEAASDPGSHAAPGASEVQMPNGARSIAPSRQEATDSPDFFPTPPWATRALLDRVFPHLERLGHCQFQSAWEPACGEGHMAEVLKEYFRSVHASDLHPYGYSAELINFLEWSPARTFDWIITNPPFGDKTEQFVLRALDLAGTGVAMFVRMQWLETIGRYERLFRYQPPTLISFFAERVPLHKGRWEPDGDTLTAYIWLVWIKGAEPRAPFWIPPGCREALTKADDAKRFGVQTPGSEDGEQAA